MYMEKRTLSFNESLSRDIKKAKEIRASLPQDLQHPDFYYQDETGEMALQLRKICKNEYSLQLSAIDDIKLLQHILSVLDGDENPEAVISFIELL